MLARLRRWPLRMDGWASLQALAMACSFAAPSTLLDSLPLIFVLLICNCLFVALIRRGSSCLLGGFFWSKLVSAQVLLSQVTSVAMLPLIVAMTTDPFSLGSCLLPVCCLGLVPLALLPAYRLVELDSGDFSAGFCDEWNAYCASRRLHIRSVAKLRRTFRRQQRQRRLRFWAARGAFTEEWHTDQYGGSTLCWIRRGHRPLPRQRSVRRRVGRHIAGCLRSVRGGRCKSVSLTYMALRHWVCLHLRCLMQMRRVYESVSATRA